MWARWGPNAAMRMTLAPCGLLFELDRAVLADGESSNEHPKGSRRIEPEQHIRAADGVPISDTNGSRSEGSVDAVRPIRVRHRG